MSVKLKLAVLITLVLLGISAAADAQLGGTLLTYQAKKPTVAIGSAPIITLNGTRALLGGNTGTQ